MTYGQILKNKRALFCLITVVVAQFFSVESFLSKHLISITFSRNVVGYVFGLFAFMYMLMAFLVSPLSKKFSSRSISFFSYLTISIGCLIFGPITLIQNAVENGCQDEPNPSECVFNAQKAFAMVGLVILGTGMGTVVVPILSELVVAIKEKMGSASK